MTTLNQKQAIELLGKYAINSRTGNILKRRIDNLIYFSKKNKNRKIKIEINNSWSKCPKHATAISNMLIGGTTYKYQVWAVVR